MMKIKVDSHVATQGVVNDEFHDQLYYMGFKDDTLQGDQTYTEAQGNVCAIDRIALHMTKKYDDLPGNPALAARGDLQRLRILFNDFSEVGYAHAEVTRVQDDVTIKSEIPLNLIPWPFEKFDARSRNENKKWDIHIGVPYRDLSSAAGQALYPDLHEVLDLKKTGLDYILLEKIRDG